LQRIHAAQTPGFAGVLSMLYIGDEPISACFNMRSGTTLHHWFPSYDKKFAKYSPGLINIIKTAQHVAELGIKTYDFGSGDYEYKTQLMTGSVPLMTGAADVSVALRMGRRAVTWARETPAVFQPLRWGYRRLRALRGPMALSAKDKSRPA
jgi:CelD/BcsL family acetyltransferase involved in cellulose biosynthesis